MRLVLHVEPVAKPRMTRRDKWAKRPAVVKYRGFCDALIWALMDEEGAWHVEEGIVVADLPTKFDVVFHVRMPESWSKKKKAEMALQPHKQTPDRDNFLKAFQDAIWKDDSHIYDGRVGKYWSDGPGWIEITWERSLRDVRHRCKVNCEKYPGWHARFKGIDTSKWTEVMMIEYDQDYHSHAK